MRFAGSAPERKHIQSLAFAIESSVGVFVMIGETETMKKMPDCEEKQGRRAVVKDISGCVAVASFAATSPQKQVMSLMSCSPFSPNPHVPRVCAPSDPSSFFSAFCFQTNNIMVRASIRDNRRRPRRRLGGGVTVGTENRRRGQTLRMRGAGRASGPVALPGGIMTVFVQIHQPSPVSHCVSCVIYFPSYPPMSGFR